MAPLIVKLDAATYSFCIADANISQRRLHIKNIQLLSWSKVKTYIGPLSKVELVYLSGNPRQAITWCRTDVNLFQFNNGQHWCAVSGVRPQGPEALQGRCGAPWCSAPWA